MVSLLNRYVPGRLFVIVVAENALFAAGICTVAWHPLWRNYDELSFNFRFLQTGVAIALICQLTFYYFGLYDLRSIASKRALVGRLLSACGACCLLMAVAAALFPPLRTRAGIMELAFAGLVLAILLVRLVSEWLNRWMTTGERIIVMGNGATARSIVREIRWRTDLNLQLLGVVSDHEYDDPVPGAKHLGAMLETPEVFARMHPDRIVLAFPDNQWQEMPVDELLRYRSHGVRVEEASTLFEKLTGRIPVESTPFLSLLFSQGFHKQTVVKRAVFRGLSVLCAVFGLLVCLPLLLLVALIIRLDSPGPILFRQERVGLFGRSFEILKFRSMRVDAEQGTGPQWASPGDSRITRVGSLLRKLRIDELPQMINILRGDMNFVGPRPERPFFVSMLKEKIPRYEMRHGVRPGLTGWAQVSHPYGASLDDSKMKLEFDLFYVKNNSLALDCAILFETVRTVVLGKGR